MSGRPSREQLLGEHLADLPGHAWPAKAAEHGFSLWDLTCRRPTKDKKPCGKRISAYVVEDTPKHVRGDQQLNAETDASRKLCADCLTAGRVSNMGKGDWTVAPHVAPEPELPAPPKVAETPRRGKGA